VMSTNRAKPEENRRPSAVALRERRVLSAPIEFSLRRNGQNLPAQAPADKMAARSRSVSRSSPCPTTRFVPLSIHTSSQ
jgi:hypothetical protein